MNKKQILTNYRKAELERTRHERALRFRVQRQLILDAYGLSDPKYLPEECKHCNNFYCTFCFKCRFLTKNTNDPDCQVRTEEKTKNFVDYENMCKAILREYLL